MVDWERFCDAIRQAWDAIYYNSGSYNWLIRWNAAFAQLFAPWVGIQNGKPWFVSYSEKSVFSIAEQYWSRNRDSKVVGWLAYLVVIAGGAIDLTRLMTPHCRDNSHAVNRDKTFWMLLFNKMPSWDKAGQVLTDLVTSPASIYGMTNVIHHKVGQLLMLHYHACNRFSSVTAVSSWHMRGVTYHSLGKKSTKSILFC